MKEGGTRKIGTQQLSATDESGHLVYEITEAPKLGRLEQTGNPGNNPIFIADVFWFKTYKSQLSNYLFSHFYDIMLLTETGILQATPSVASLRII